MTMGTAATMMSLAEALGLTLPGAASIPAPDSNHSEDGDADRQAHRDMVWEDLKPRDFLKKESFDNAIVTLMAMGGSTQRADPPRRQRPGAPASSCRSSASTTSRRRCRCSPTSARRATNPDGGFLLRGRVARPPRRAERNLLHLKAKTVQRQRPSARTSPARAIYNADVIRKRKNPLKEVRRPGGAARQPPPSGGGDQSLGDEDHRKHTGKAVVFDDYNDMGRAHRPRRPRLQRRLGCWCCGTAGPLGGPGMPEWACCRCRRSS